MTDWKTDSYYNYVRFPRNLTYGTEQLSCNSARYLKFRRKITSETMISKGKVKIMTNKSPNFPTAAGKQYFY